MEIKELENCKSKLKKHPFIERKVLYPILTDLTSLELDEIFSDEEIIKRIISSRDNNILTRVFHYSGPKTQERLWQDPENQKKLIGMGNVSDETLLNSIKDNKFYHSTELEKKKKAGKFYFSKERMHTFNLFVKSIKSDAILDSLTANIYYQMIILFSKNVPPQVIKRVDTLKLYENIVDGPLYQYASRKLKVQLCVFINNVDSHIILPKDYLQILTETIINPYGTNNKTSVGYVLKSKLYHLGLENRMLKLDIDTLELLTIRDIMVLLSADDKVVDKEKLNSLLIEYISNAVRDGSIFSKKYLDFELLDNDTYFSIFQTIIKVLTSGDKKQEFLNYIFNALFQEEYTDEEKKEIYPLLQNSLLNIDKKTAVNLFFRPTDIKSMFFVRYGLSSRYMDYLNGISSLQILRLNVKHINKLVSFLEDETQDEISDTYSKAIKLYCAFGLERSLAILKGEYGKVSKDLLNNISKLVVKDTGLKKNGKSYEPILNKGFITFLFQSGQIKHLFDGESNMFKSWYYLFNNFEELKELCHGHLTFSKVEIILKEKINTVNYQLPPNCYLLEDKLQEIGVGNKTKYRTNDVYDEAVKIYQEQIKRMSSSIPYVKGKTKDGYTYETMKLHDPLAYVLGYRASCCIRVLDIAHKHLLHALLCESGRILIIYDRDGNPAAFSPLKRNGEVLIANSIEAIARDNMESIQNAFKEGVEAIVEKTKDEEEEKHLKVVTIGRGSFYKPESTEWPSNIPTPTILEKNNETYKHTDEYHKSLNVVYQEPKCVLSSLEYGKNKVFYEDPREKIQACNFKDDEYYNIQQKALNVINSVNFECSSEEERKVFNKVGPHGIEYVVFGSDWYIIIYSNSRIEYKCITYDKRAEKEMKASLALIKESSNIKDVRRLVLSIQKEDQLK